MPVFHIVAHLGNDHEDLEYLQVLKVTPVNTKGTFLLEAIIPVLFANYVAAKTLVIQCPQIFH